MQASLTLNGKSWSRTLSFVFGLGMMVASVFTIRHFFLANYPTSIYAGSFCDINSFFNCDSSAFSVISQVGGVPLGYFGLIVGALVCLGAVFPSISLERTNKTISIVNFVGVVGLFLFSVLYLKSLCLLCTGYYLFSIASFLLFWKYGIDRDDPSWLSRHFSPSLKHLVTIAIITLLGAYGMVLFHHARRDAQSGGVAARVVTQYYNLAVVKPPSLISPYRTVQSTEKFEDAPIQIIEYADFLCPDCLFLTQQMGKLKEEFKGKINIAYQFFPLEARCNQVVEKDKHPGACDLSYLAAYDPAKFSQIHDEIFANFEKAKDPAWRNALARKYQLEGALNDARTKELVQRIINTGNEYEKTSEKYSHGIRSTPTLIVNNRMIIGTLPYAQLRAIFQALVEEREKAGGKRFLENWVPTK
ncbi:MAG: thioredoxin domain-containing protein [Terriglobia bacterium]